MTALYSQSCDGVLRGPELVAILLNVHVHSDINTTYHLVDDFAGT